MFIIVQELQQVNCFNQSHQRHPFCQAQLFFSGLILLSVLVSTDKADPPSFPEIVSSFAFWNPTSHDVPPQSLLRAPHPA